MAKPGEGERQEKRNEEEWPLAAGFKASWQKFKTDEISDAMTTFDRYKRAVPPKQLPAKMRDHKLGGPLKAYNECHLAPDVLLIYKPMRNGAIKLFRVCEHADLRGPKAKILVQQLRNE
jgi:mRNA interferase YafQ